MVNGDKRSEFQKLKLQAEKLPEEKVKSEENMGKARIILQKLLSIVTRCKILGLMPPYDLIKAAKELVDQFPELANLFQDIITAEREATQTASEKTGILPQDLRELEKLIATNPCAAAEYYFNLISIKEMHNVIDQINNGESIPDDAKYNKYKKTLENTEDIRSRLAQKLAVEVEELRKKATEPDELDKVKKNLEKLGEEQLHAAALRKYHNNPNKTNEIKEIRELNNILDEHKIERKDIAAVPERHLDDFVISYNPELLKQVILSVKKNIDQQAQINIDTEKAKEKKAQQESLEKEQKVVDKEIIKEHTKVETKGSYTDKLANKERGKQVTLDAKRLAMLAKKQVKQASELEAAQNLRKVLTKNKSEIDTLISSKQISHGKDRTP